MYWWHSDHYHLLIIIKCLMPLKDKYPFWWILSPIVRIIIFIWMQCSIFDTYHQINNSSWIIQSLLHSMEKQLIIQLDEIITNMSFSPHLYSIHPVLQEILSFPSRYQMWLIRMSLLHPMLLNQNNQCIIYLCVHPYHQFLYHWYDHGWNIILLMVLNILQSMPMICILIGRINFMNTLKSVFFLF